MSVLDLSSGMTKLLCIYHGRFLDSQALQMAPTPWRVDTSISYNIFRQRQSVILST